MVYTISHMWNKISYHILYKISYLGYEISYLGYKISYILIQLSNIY